MTRRLSSSLRNGSAVIAGGAASSPRLEGWILVFLMVRDGAPDSASALPGERLLTMRSESHHPGRRAMPRVVTHRRHRHHDQHVRGAELMIDHGTIADIGAKPQISLDQRRQLVKGCLRIDRFLWHPVHL